jgi:adenosylhomocysteine nucleosidase
VQKNQKVAIVAAIEREVWPLVKDWRVVEREYQGRRFKFFENDHAVLVCGGIGAEAARRAGEAAIVLYDPILVLSVGFAGALDPDLRAGAVIRPRTVVDTGDGSRVECGDGDGVLVSFAAIAGADQKARLARAYGAQAVDMEAAAVARAAQAHGIGFSAVKAISDEAGLVMPPLQEFIGDDGQLRTARLIVFATVRPWLWRKMVQLARNTSRAAKALCAALDRYNQTAEMNAKPELEPAVGQGR